MPPIRSKALLLYDGARTPHRSCGIALAEAFDRPTAAYQSLRRGGITGRGTCGAVVAGQLLLGEFSACRRSDATARSAAPRTRGTGAAAPARW